MTAETWDVVVIGGGMSGLAAALAASQAGARVVVCEKTARPGGNANLSAGIFLGAKDFAGLNGYIPEGDASLQRLVCDELAPAVAWLEANGMPIGEDFGFGDFRVARPMGAGRPGDRSPFMALMAERARDSGVDIRFQAAMTELRKTDTGFRVLLGDGAELASPAVVLSTGGFQAGKMLAERYLGPAAANLLVRSVPGNSGDGLQAALGLGAATGGDMTAFYGHTMPDGPIPPDEYQPMTPYFARLGLLINRDGRRFVDEGSSLLEEINPQEGYKQPGGVFFLLFDEAMYQPDPEGSGSDRVVPNPNWMARARELELPLMNADTLEDLADMLHRQEGVPGDRVLELTRSYNEAHGGGTLDRLDPPRSGDALPLSTPPFYAMRCVAGITATCGGIAVDDNTRVLDGNGNPIAGLFAAGVDAGGVYGRRYGGFLGWSLVSGRIAGAGAVSQAST